MEFRKNILKKIDDSLYRTLFVAEGFFEDGDEKNSIKLKKILCEKFPRLKKLEEIKDWHIDFQNIDSCKKEDIKVYSLCYDVYAPLEVVENPIKYLQEKGVIKGNSPLNAKNLEKIYESMFPKRGVIVNLKEDLKIKIEFYIDHLS